MVSPMFSSLLDSEIFTLVAKGGKKFTVHGSILAAQSEPFRRIVTGDWKESIERVVSLEDWGSDTVGRLVEFLYSGNYQYPDPEPLHPSGGGAVGEVGREVVVDPVPRDEELGQDRPLTPLGQCIPDGLHHERRGIDKEARLGKFRPLGHNYKKVLLVHADVYELAQYKDIVALQSLSLDNLLMTLMSIGPLEPGTHLAIDFVEFLGHVYSHTNTLVSSEEPMRRIVSQLAALHFPALQQTEEMEKLMSQGGDLVQDLMRKVSRRLVASEHKANKLHRYRAELAKLKLELEAYKHQSSKLYKVRLILGDSNMSPSSKVSRIRQAVE